MTTSPKPVSTGRFGVTTGNHHYKNEHYWFTVTSSGTADRVLGTYPDLATVATSPTAKNLHADVA